MTAKIQALERLAQCHEPISDEALRRLRAEGCNAAELSAYTGHDPADAVEIVYGPWWLPIGWDS